MNRCRRRLVAARKNDGGIGLGLGAGDGSLICGGEAGVGGERCGRHDESGRLREQVDRALAICHRDVDRVVVAEVGAVGGLGGVGVFGFGRSAGVTGGDSLQMRPIRWFGADLRHNLIPALGCRRGRWAGSAGRNFGCGQTKKLTPFWGPYKMRLCPLLWGQPFSTPNSLTVGKLSLPGQAPRQGNAGKPKMSVATQTDLAPFGWYPDPPTAECSAGGTAVSGPITSNTRARRSTPEPDTAQAPAALPRFSSARASSH